MAWWSYRLDIIHHMYNIMLDGQLTLAPIGMHPQRILDVGTGTLREMPCALHVPCIANIHWGRYRHRHLGYRCG